jgi:phosphoglycolate phosphatase-like HAD superfamily hydrolase
MVICSDTVSYPRPHAYGINKILANFQVKSYECFKLGDTEADIMEAVNAKCLPLGITSSRLMRKLMYDGGAHTVINNLCSLPKLFSPIARYTDDSVYCWQQKLKN